MSMSQYTVIGSIYYGVADKWDKTSPNPNGGTAWQNHDSTMDKAEVIRLTAEGVALLKKQTLGTIQATKDKNLRAAYDEVIGGRTVFVTILKGIHQRGSKPHITARIVGKATMHIWLSSVDAPGTITTPSGNLAPSMATGWTYKAIGVSASAPTDDKPGSGSIVPACSVIGIRRRGSVSGPAMAAILESEREKLIQQDLLMKGMEESLYGNSAL
jgi:hypothetical protein